MAVGVRGGFGIFGYFYNSLLLSKGRETKSSGRDKEYGGGSNKERLKVAILV